MIARGFRLLVLALAALQLVQLGLRAATVHSNLGLQSEVLAGTRETAAELGFLSLQAGMRRDLLAVASELPESGRVLVLTSIPIGVRFDFLLLPREVALLIDLNEDVWLAEARRRPKHAPQIERRIEEIRELDEELTEERLAEELSRADRVLVISFLGPLPFDEERYALAAEHGTARVYRRSDGERAR